MLICARTARTAAKGTIFGTAYVRSPHDAATSGLHAAAPANGSTRLWDSLYGSGHAATADGRVPWVRAATDDAGDCQGYRCDRAAKLAGEADPGD